jgi:hypothetical protein
VRVGESQVRQFSSPQLYSAAAVKILGTAGIPPRDILADAFQKVIERAARGELRIDVEQVSLTDVEDAWRCNGRGRRLVLVP